MSDPTEAAHRSELARREALTWAAEHLPSCPEDARPYAAAALLRNDRLGQVRSVENVRARMAQMWPWLGAYLRKRNEEEATR